MAYFSCSLFESCVIPNIWDVTALRNRFLTAGSKQIQPDFLTQIILSPNPR